MKSTDHPTAAYLLGFGLGLTVASCSWLAANAERQELDDAEHASPVIAAWVPGPTGHAHDDADRETAKAALADAGVPFAEGGARLFKGGE